MYKIRINDSPIAYGVLDKHKIPIVPFLSILTHITKKYIRRNGRPEKVKYDGKFINDITPYLQEKGLYYIRVDAEYKNVKSKIEFFVEQKQKNKL